MPKGISSLKLMNFKIRIATEADIIYAIPISGMYHESAKQRGTGIAIRTPEYISEKIIKGNAIIAFLKDELAGFCYVETFSRGNYVSNSGLIVVPIYRSLGLAKTIKEKAFNHARFKFPNARVFGITTNSRVMEINSELGYIPVSFNKLTDDDEFWMGCKSCPNFDILQRNERKMCLCTGMLASSLNEYNRINSVIKPIKKEI